MYENADSAKEIRRAFWKGVFITMAVIILTPTISLLAWDNLRDKTPVSLFIDVPAGLEGPELAVFVGGKLGWATKDSEEFSATLSKARWSEFDDTAVQMFTERYDWKEAEKAVFLANATHWFKPEYDFLSTVYEPGTYEIEKIFSTSQISGLFIARAKKASENNKKKYLAYRLSEAGEKRIADFVKKQVELLPDIVPLPAQDVQIKRSNGKTLLLFSTTYYNKGSGALELRGDPEKKNVQADDARKVFQRIYRTDGGLRDKEVGVFFWEESHLHHHFADFISYDLEALEVEGKVPDLSGLYEKTTYCVRDVSKVKLELKNRAPEAGYKICYKDLQGVSVGWGDTYFYNYPGQSLDITGLPSGTYSLKFVVNPENRLEEASIDNNTSATLLDIDMKKFTVKIIEETPKDSPEVEHIYPTQEGCSICIL